MTREPAAVSAEAEIPRLRRVPRQARSRERLQRLLDAADELLARDGAEALTTTRVAEAAGVSVGSLYQYLPDKAAIVEALANRYLTEFEGLMERFVEEARSGPGDWSDPPGLLVDAFAALYRERPGYRALWFGRELSGELRDADRRNKLALAEGVRKILVALRVAPDDRRLRIAAWTGVLVADSLLQEAFRADPRGERELIEEAKRILRLYLADVACELGVGNARRRQRRHREVEGVDDVPALAERVRDRPDDHQEHARPEYVQEPSSRTA